MENASKALLIAGAILVVILIIALGMFIFNNAANVVQSANMDEQEVRQFNARFEAYFGARVRGANVNSLLDLIVTNNNTSEDPSRQVAVVSTVANITPVPDFTTVRTFAVQTRALTGNTYVVGLPGSTVGGQTLGGNIQDAYNNVGLIRRIAIDLRP